MNLLVTITEENLKKEFIQMKILKFRGKKWNLFIYTFISVIFIFTSISIYMYSFYLKFKKNSHKILYGE